MGKAGTLKTETEKLKKGTGKSDKKRKTMT
jgi:hypothetical protein